MPTDNDNPAAMPSFEINRLVRELRARVAALEAERDALLRHCVQRNAFDGTWEAMTKLVDDGWEWEAWNDEAAAITAVRQAAGLDRGEG